MGDVGTATDPTVLIHPQRPPTLLFRQLGQVGLIPPVQCHGAGERNEQKDVPTEEEEGDEVVRVPEGSKGDAQEEAHYVMCCGLLRNS